MGSSTKKKKEKSKDFQKTKLKVGKARPKNTNATDTSFSARNIVLKQQSLSETARSADALFKHNLSLLASKAETQRRDALAYLTSAAVSAAQAGEELPVPAESIAAKAQPLILDSNASVRTQLLKLLRALPAKDLTANLEQLLLYTRAGMSHLATDIRLSSLEALDWLLASNGNLVVSLPGGWVKTLRQFQTLLQWHEGGDDGVVKTVVPNTWTQAKNSTAAKGTGLKLLVQQLTTLARFLTAGLISPPYDASVQQQAAAIAFPLSAHVEAHMVRKSNPYGYLNLFGAVRDVEGEVYESWEERAGIFDALGLRGAFAHGVREAKKEAGEVGRAASAVEKAMRLGVAKDEG